MHRRMYKLFGSESKTGQNFYRSSALLRKSKNNLWRCAELDYKTVNASITVPVVTQTLPPTTTIKPENGTAPSSLVK
uniref:Uncharacterized protein n=1 Tax=Globodera pallida TaxID=36090 RepID=A0A183BZ71_GLOPA